MKEKLNKKNEARKSGHWQGVRKGCWAKERHGETAKGFGLREVTCPTSPSEGGTGLSPVPDLGGCWHLLYLVLVSSECWLPNRCCWEEEGPRATGNLLPPFSVCGLPYTSLAPRLLWKRAIPARTCFCSFISCCGCCWLLYCEQMPFAQLIDWKLHTAAAGKREPELSYLQRLFKWKLQTPLHPPITLFNIQLSLSFRKLLKHANR